MSSSSSSRKVDVLFLSHVGYFTGGAEKSLLELAKDCLDQGLSVRVLLPNGEFTSVLRKNSIPFSVIDPYWWTLPTKKQERIHNAKAVAECVRYIESYNPKVCVTNTMVSPPLAFAAAMADVPHFWILREYGELDHQLKFRLGINKTNQLISLLSDKIFCNSESLKAYYSEQTGRKDIGVVRPYVEHPRYSKMGSKIDVNDLRLVMVGTIQPGKGQHEAIEAVAHLKNKGFDPHLKIVGRGSSSSYYTQLQRLIKRLGLSENVQFLGQLDNPFEVVADSDIALVCSANEAFGRVTVEYMYLGVPVVGANSGGTAGLIDDGQTGLLYSPGDSKDLAQKIILLAKNAATANRIAEKAHSTAGEKFSRSKAHQEFFKALRFSLSDKPRNSLDLSILKDLLELQSDKDRWHKKEMADAKKLLTQADGIIKSVQAENTRLNENRGFFPRPKKTRNRPEA